jgi:hypothetical protein
MLKAHEVGNNMKIHKAFVFKDLFYIKKMATIVFYEM